MCLTTAWRSRACTQAWMYSILDCTNFLQIEQYYGHWRASRHARWFKCTGYIQIFQARSLNVPISELTDTWCGSCAGTTCEGGTNRRFSTEERSQELCNPQGPKKGAANPCTSVLACASAQQWKCESACSRTTGATRLSQAAKTCLQNCLHGDILGGPVYPRGPAQSPPIWSD